MGSNLRDTFGSFADFELDTQLAPGGFRRTLEWRLNSSTEARFQELISQLDFFEEGTEECEAIKDQIRSLPGHPSGTDERDYIRRVVVDFQV